MMIAYYIAYLFLIHPLSEKIVIEFMIVEVDTPKGPLLQVC